MGFGISEEIVKNRLVVFGILLMVLIACQPIETEPKADLDVKCGSYPVFIPVKMENVDRKSIVWSVEGAGSLEPMKDGNVRYKLPADCSSQLGSIVTVKANFQNVSERYILRLAPKRIVDSVVCLGEKCFSFDKKNRPPNDLNSPENLKPLEGFLPVLAQGSSISIDKEGWAWIRSSSGSIYVYPGGLPEFALSSLNDNNLVKTGRVSAFAIDLNGDLVVFYGVSIPLPEVSVRRYFRSYLYKANTPEAYEDLNGFVPLSSRCPTGVSSFVFDTNNNSMVNFSGANGNFCAYGFVFTFLYNGQFVKQDFDRTRFIANSSGSNYVAGPNGGFWGLSYGFPRTEVGGYEAFEVSRIESWHLDAATGKIDETHFDYAFTQRRFGRMAFDEDGDLWIIELIPDDPLAYPNPTFSSELSEYSLSTSGRADTLTLKNRVKTPNLEWNEGIKFYGF